MAWFGQFKNRTQMEEEEKLRQGKQGLNLLFSSFSFQGGEILSLPSLTPKAFTAGPIQRKINWLWPALLRAEQPGLRDEWSLASDFFCPHWPTHCE